jgi:hypothetical protein
MRVSLDLRQGVQEVLRNLRKRYFADHDQQGHAMLNDSGKLIGRVADALVVRNADAAVAAAVFEPLLIGPVRGKEIAVPLDGEACGSKDFGEAFT